MQGFSGNKVPRLDMCRSIISSKKHQMCHNHPFSQRNKETKRAVEVDFFLVDGWAWVSWGRMGDRV